MKRYTQLTNRPGQGVEKLLGELELEVMRVVWAQEAVTVRAVLEALAEKRPLAYTTVMTIMSRLAEKGLLAIEKQGKIYHYRATQTLEDFKAQAVGRVVQSLITDFGGAIAVNQFVEQLSAVDPDQLQRLAEMVRLAQEEEHGA